MKTAEEYLSEALGGNMNVSALKPLAWHEIMDGYAKEYHSQKSRESSQSEERAAVQRRVRRNQDEPNVIEMAKLYEDVVAYVCGVVGMPMPTTKELATETCRRVLVNWREAVIGKQFMKMINQAKALGSD